ncbi:MAG: class I SAM-dependent rRNA methyltransferase [Anaerolineae bacterium]|nr:class I SAM-dependent rRNA methyltransferase [Anaerolineae bacterium]MDW8173057.1 class I SAM-dependent rRNA methyltransferase [Anaerolineae bacterium]
MKYPRLIIAQDREKPVRQRHPWVFSGAIARTEGDPQPGDLVDVRAHDGEFLARGYYNPRSQIQARLLTWRDEPLNDAWWRQQLGRALETRRFMRTNQACALRLVNAESDYLPGLIVDQYGSVLVLQALTLYIDQHKQRIAGLLADLLQPRTIYERSDVDVRAKEGLKRTTGLLWGEEPPERFTYTEASHVTHLWVDVKHGHKTGAYLDQRDNRYWVQSAVDSLTGEVRLLNLFSYSGGFGVVAAEGENRQRLHIVNVDSSNSALALAADNARLNHVPHHEEIEADALDFLRQEARSSARYDVVVLDPPKFAHNKEQIDSAARGYKDLNLNAFRVIREGGYLATFSCSGSISRDLFQKIVFGALADSGRQAQIVRHLQAAPDHPIALTFPEGEYLKGLLLRVW